MALNTRYVNYSQRIIQLTTAHQITNGKRQLRIHFLRTQINGHSSAPVTDIEQKLISNSDYAVWHICSEKHMINMGECYIGLFSERLIGSISAKLCVDIIVAIVNRRFNQHFSNAINAGLKFRAYTSLSGLSLILMARLKK